jgi:hypothetical protein
LAAWNDSDSRSANSRQFAKRSSGFFAIALAITAAVPGDIAEFMTCRDGACSHMI